MAKYRRKKKIRLKDFSFILYLLVITALFVIGAVKYGQGGHTGAQSEEIGTFESLPADADKNAYEIRNDNRPYFTEDEIKAESFESYSDLDALGRCGVATACLSTDTMPAPGEERQPIGHVRPSGWHTVKYPGIIEDLYCFNRAHLIGWQLGSENDNEKNLSPAQGSLMSPECSLLKTRWPNTSGRQRTM